MLGCNQLARRRDYPDEYPAFEGLGPNDVVCRGGSVIVGPLGEVLAGPLFHEEGILTAELDLGQILRAKYDFDVTGHYARPDIFHLVVNEAPMPPVVVRGDGL